LMDTKMEILPENVDLRQLFVLIYFPDRSKGQTILYAFLLSSSISITIKRTIHYVSSSHFSF
jgi:hypothetical protein